MGIEHLRYVITWESSIFCHLIIDGAQPANAPVLQLSRFGFIRKRFRFARFRGRVTELSGRPQMRFRIFCEFACIVAFHPVEYFCGSRVRQDFSDAWTRFVNLSIYHPGTSAALAKAQLADAGFAAGHGASSASLWQPWHPPMVRGPGNCA